MDLKFMQDLHNKEIATRESLAHRASTIIAGMTTLGGIVVFIVVNYNSFGSYIDIVFWLLFVASCITLASATFYLIWSYCIPPFLELASPKELFSYWNELKEQVKSGKITSAKIEFNDYLLSQYVEIGDSNVCVNYKRGSRLVKSNYYMLASFVLIVLTSIVFYYNNYILKKEIVQKGDAEMFTGENAFICIQSSEFLDASGRPKPRPVPLPRPVPMPTPREPEPGPH